MSDDTVLRAQHAAKLAKWWSDSIRRRMAAVECQLIAEGMPRETAGLLAEAIVMSAVNEFGRRNFRGEVDGS